MNEQCKAKIYVREYADYRYVDIKNSGRCQLSNETIQQWQDMLDLLVELQNVSAAMIMRMTPTSLKVFLKSNNIENPYPLGDEHKLCLGVYCESAIGTNGELFVKNANESDLWRDNPDMEVGMSSYCGVPIKWPDGKFFGTLCLLKTSEIDDIEHVHHLLSFFSASMEKDLHNLCLMKNVVEANDEKTKFLGRMSHDMRTPMNAIIGYSNFGIEEFSDKQCVKYFSQIKDSGTYLLGLLNDILEMSKLENGSIELHNNVFSDKHFVEKVLSIVSPKAIEKGVELVMDFPAQMSKYRICDEMRTTQIAVNLLNNALKYTPPGGKVTWYARLYDIDGETYSTHSFIDNGVGMSEEFQSKLFEPFSQEQNPLSDNEGGTGLGLSITKKLVELMGGTISCTSKLGEGSTFTINVPVTLASDEQIAEYTNRKPLYSYPNHSHLAGKRVLLCEDVEVNAKIAAKILESAGMLVDFAENGKIGVDKSKSESYAAIIMDIRMPVMDGLEATREIRTFNKTTPIIALSANAYSDDIQKSYNVGINSHLAKPIDRMELLDTLAVLLHKYTPD